MDHRNSEGRPVRGGLVREDPITADVSGVFHVLGSGLNASHALSHFSHGPHAIGTYVYASSTDGEAEVVR